MIRSMSIGRRLTLLLAGVAALLSLLSWSMVSGLARQAAARTQDNVLAASASTIAETLRSEQGEVRLELPYSAFSMLGAISEDRVFYRVTAGERLLTGYSDLPAPEPDQANSRVTFGNGTYRGAEVRMVSVRRVVLAGDRPVSVIVTVAQTLDGVAAISGQISRFAAGLSLAFFVLAVGLSEIAVRTSLRPLNSFAQSVSRRGPSDLRPLRPGAPAELVPLRGALNRLMERLAQSIRRSEDFIAEAAHRVRTPLATVRAQAEIALRSTSDAEDRHRLRQIIRAVDESSRSAGQLLDHATVAFRAEHLARDPVDLAELVNQTTEALTPTAEMKDIELKATTVSVTVHGDAVLLYSALRNVLDNAIKYSPEDTTVRIDISEAGAEARISISDEGPGFGAGPAEELKERFRRGGNTEGVVGSGLGLTIAADVLAAHGGRLDLGAGQKGEGACVTLVLPTS